MNIYWTKFFYQFFNNFLELLLICEINNLDIFDIVDFFEIFVNRED